MDYVEYLKKVAAAKKHWQEYVGGKGKIYLYGMWLGTIGFLLSGHFPIIVTWSLAALSVISGIVGLMKKIRAEKDFGKEFKKEADIIAEHDELLK